MPDKKTSLIQQAAIEGQWKIVNSLVKATSTDIADTFHYGEVLRLAVCANNIEVATVLLQASAPTTSKEYQTKNTCLHEAAFRHNKEMVALLLDNQAVLTAKNNDNKTPIQLAAAKGYWDIVQLLASHHKDISDSAHYGCALLYAVSSGQVEVANKLLQMGAVTTWRFNETKNSSLHLAVRDKHKELVALLIEYGADMTVQNSDGKTPIMLAVQHGWWELVTLMAEKGKNDEADNAHFAKALADAVAANAVDAMKALIYRMTLTQKAQLLQQAIEQNKDALTKLLIESDVNHLNMAVETTHGSLLHALIFNHKPELVAILLAHGADPKKRDNDGLTPIELACIKKHWECAAPLIKCNPLQLNQSAMSGKAFIEAIRANQIEVVRYLAKSGADTMFKSESSGETALDCAIKEQHEAAVHFLMGTHAFATDNLPEADRIQHVGILMVLGALLHAVPQERRWRKVTDWCKLVGKAGGYRQQVVWLLINDMRVEKEALQQRMSDAGDFASEEDREKLRQARLLLTMMLKYEDTVRGYNDATENTLRQLCTHFPVAKRLWHVIQLDKNMYEWADAIHKELMQLQRELRDCSGEWLVNGIISGWRKGKPNHIERLERKLAQLTDESKPGKVVGVYLDVVFCLERMTQHSSRRHPKTQHYYNQLYDRMMNMNNAIKAELADPLFFSEALKAPRVLSAISNSNEVNEVQASTNDKQIVEYPSVANVTSSSAILAALPLTAVALKPHPPAGDPPLSQQIQLSSSTSHSMCIFPVVPDNSLINHAPSVEEASEKKRQPVALAQPF